MLVEKIKDKIKRMYESGEYEFILGNNNNQISISKKDINPLMDYDKIYLYRFSKGINNGFFEITDEAIFPFDYRMEIRSQSPNLFQEEMEDVYNFTLSIIERCEHNNENRGMNRNMIEWLES